VNRRKGFCSPGETRERAWSVSVSPLKDQAGRTQAVWIGVLDITEKYGARQRLTLLNEAGTHVGTTLDVTRTAQELADMVVPRLADLAVVDLLDAVFSGDEPRPGPLTGTIALRRVAHQSIFEGVPEAVVKPGDIDIHPESFPSARCLATGKAVLPVRTAGPPHHPAGRFASTVIPSALSACTGGGLVWLCAGPVLRWQGTGLAPASRDRGI
jgi:hypothetical protein